MVKKSFFKIKLKTGEWLVPQYGRQYVITLVILRLWDEDFVVKKTKGSQAPLLEFRI